MYNVALQLAVVESWHVNLLKCGELVAPVVPASHQFFRQCIVPAQVQLPDFLKQDLGSHHEGGEETNGVIQSCCRLEHETLGVSSLAGKLNHVFCRKGKAVFIRLPRQTEYLQHTCLLSQWSLIGTLVFKHFREGCAIGAPLMELHPRCSKYLDRLVAECPGVLFTFRARQEVVNVDRSTQSLCCLGEYVLHFFEMMS
ncbi:unnamed protein product [Ixodes pacificus]